MQIFYVFLEEEMDEPNYQTLENRLKTFQRVRIDKSIENFAKAGFFFEKDNNIKCFFCGLTLKNWKSIIDRSPLEYHAHFSTACLYVIAVAGQIFIDNCRNDDNLKNGLVVVKS